MPSRKKSSPEIRIPNRNPLRATSDDVQFRNTEPVAKKAVTLLNEPNVVATAYGGGLIDPNSVEAAAKISTDPDSGRSIYYVKVGEMGVDQGQLYNPQAPHFNKRQAHGKGRFTFRKTSKAAYDFYVRFLNSGSPTDLRNAAREMTN